MILKKQLIFFFLMCFACNLSLSAQDKKKKDSAAMYRQIEKYSQRSKFGKLMHKLIFEPTAIKKSNPIRKPKNRFKTYEGKIIRNIKIITLDPFGFSEIDTAQKPRNWTEKYGNKLHLKSSQRAIRNLILLKKNQPLDSLLVKESERLIRTQRFINRVFISSQFVNAQRDSIDVTIRVLDSWSIIPNGSISDSRIDVKLLERNFVGSGHEFETEYTQRFNDRKVASKFRYTFPNFKNTFIRSTISYQRDLDDNYSKILNIERPFYSPFTKYAGGIYLDQQYKTDALQQKDLTFETQNFKTSSQDFWFGKSIAIFNGNSEGDRTTKLILTGRFLNIDFLEKPKPAFDTIGFYSSEKMFFSGIGIASRQFVEDKYVFYNGITEDVPVGTIYGITGGYQFKNHRERLYLGARASFGNYFKWGYLSTNFEYGTFFNNQKTNQSAFVFQANYFTNLIALGRWKIRQFLKPQLILGTNRLPTNGDKLTINEQNGIQGFNSPIYGTKKFVFTFQTQAYSPWNFAGFRLNPYFNYSIGMLGNPNIPINQNKSYSKIGVGLLISNDFLVFSSFQISFSYYPKIPGQGENIFKTNSFNSEDFGLQDFNLAKPRTVIYK